MSTDEDKFAEAVLACVDGVNALLPDLAARYPDLVMVTALAEHVGAALRLCMRNGSCTPEQARQIVRHMGRTAFPEGAPLGAAR